jgi:hypothetical protein
MKTRFFAIVVMMSFMLAQKAGAQAVQMATLQHGETMKAFYGLDALSDALASATNGDVISLSEGVFNAPTFNKAVTVQGAGFFIDKENKQAWTSIKDNPVINVPNGDTGLKIEGIHFAGNVSIEGDSLCNFTITKCRIGDLTATAKLVEGEISQSYIKNIKYAETRKLYIHHVVMHTINATSDYQISVDIDHCVLTGNMTSSVTAVVRNSLLKNVRGTASCAFYNDVISQNCVYGYQYDWHGHITSIYLAGNTIWTFDTWKYEDTHSSYNSLFVTPSNANTWNEYNDYKLTEEAAAQYTCPDGTQVGLYGGTVPFTKTLSTPQIISKNIATETDENGMLNVKIQVEAQK